MNDRTAEQAQHLIDSGEIDDVLDELGQRIINGAVTELTDATDHLTEQLLNSRLDHRDARGSVEHISGALAGHVWANCARTARRWADQTTDPDRLLAAFAELNRAGIVSGLFTNWKAMEITPEHRGAVLVRRDDWQDLSFLHRRRLTISFVGVSEDESEVGRELTRALRAAGLAASAPNHGKVTVRLLWKWHVPEPVGA
ncbi:DUF6891 domain-containing protein [Corynebacterium pygosceleis]|uniref:DUF6891 domain-containing protein n=1 Tax=Corynebacterium pygosceleis TaxID=2800406 RepID=A0A9Q4GLM3_9CORY|nr:hypothetical protein [Corynebacterium pygosceleis]MCK7638217.1 hypothetical protein [Corynebacterium pygosceleis]MCK7676262.1 hypothetical protein [Corynebacterium pygosceleis]MCL0121579.1 hypothetical protein [Corynebacterium pygosceleis]MCX7445776.1 hypothetical protein [Corynebacterium pygosceleis]MCX7469372.1 hypothetical protein [Corynebacterium pygosceleis]